MVVSSKFLMTMTKEKNGFALSVIKTVMYFNGSLNVKDLGNQ